VIVAATEQGVFDLTGETAALGGRDVAFVSRRQGHMWALADFGRTVLRDGEALATLDDVATVLHPLDADSAIVALVGAHVVHVDGKRVRARPAFDRVPGRDSWYNPAANDRPDLWSFAEDSAFLYASVHVGGLWRTADTGASWENVLAPEVDIHQVTANDDFVVAAAQRGFGWSTDHGSTWSWTTEGLHADYLQSVGLAGDTVFIGVSTGPFGRDAAVYRAEVPGARFERRSAGLPDELQAIGPYHLAVDGDLLAAVQWNATRVFASDDAGASWRMQPTEYPAIRSLAVA
jgi:hypothetical protein